MNKLIHFLQLSGFTWFVPVARMASGESPKEQLQQLWLIMGIPIIAFTGFLFLWGQLAQNIETSLGKIPGPAEVITEAKGLMVEHRAEREKQDAFYDRQEKRNAEKLAADPNAEIKWREYTGKPTYIDQMATSLQTVFAGFLLASLLAIPLGIITAFYFDGRTNLTPRQIIYYVESWPADRSDEEIKAKQKADLADLRRRQAERQRQLKAIDDELRRLGI